MEEGEEGSCTAYASGKFQEEDKEKEEEEEKTKRRRERAAATRAAHLNWLGMVRAGIAATEGKSAV